MLTPLHIILVEGVVARLDLQLNQPIAQVTVHISIRNMIDVDRIFAARARARSRRTPIVQSAGNAGVQRFAGQRPDMDRRGSHGDRRRCSSAWCVRDCRRWPRHRGRVEAACDCRDGRRSNDGGRGKRFVIAALRVDGRHVYDDEGEGDAGVADAGGVGVGVDEVLDVLARAWIDGLGCSLGDDFTTLIIVHVGVEPPLSVLEADELEVVLE